MLALRSSPPSFSAAEGERIARDYFALVGHVAPLPGERDCNFHLRTADARDFVLKILDASADLSGTESLMRVLSHLNEQDDSLLVPRIVPSERGAATIQFVRDGTDYTACLLNFLPGQLLIDAMPAPALFGQLGRELARIDRGLQGFFHPSLARHLAWDLRNLPELAGQAVALLAADLQAPVLQVAERMRQLLPQLRGLRSQAIHGDCHAHNVLVDDSATQVCGLLDFGDVVHAPLIFEPAVAMAELLLDGFSLQQVTALLRGYVSVQALQVEETRLLFELITARHAVTLLLHAWRGAHDPRGAKLLQRTAHTAAALLKNLLARGREAFDSAAAGAAIDLARRHRLMGAGAELFYQKPLHFVRGEGVWLFDTAGRAYLDVYNNVPHVGHSHPKVADAIARQAAVLSTHSRYLHDDILRYAESLTAKLPEHLNTCIFVNSGSEANDVAWRIAKMLSGQQGALVMSHAYHGITDAVGALTPGAGEPRDPWVAALSATAPGAALDAEAAIEALQSRGYGPAAWFIDSSLTSSGVYDPPPHWAQTLAQRVRAAGALIVADEVQYGLARCGSHFWGFERRGLSPDIVTMGKPLGNGFPMGVVVANRAIVEAFQAKYGFFSTFGGNAVAAGAGLAVLEVLEEEQLQANAERTGSYLRARLAALAVKHPCLGQVRGHGLLLGVPVLAEDAATSKRRTSYIVNTLAAEHRILIGSEGPTASVLKLRPPMPFREAHADLLLAAIDAAASGVEA